MEKNDDILVKLVTGKEGGGGWKNMRFSFLPTYV
jgi:hypothetical protein